MEKWSSIVGSKVSSFDAKDEGGKDLRIEFPHRKPTLLYVFSPTCGYCRMNETAFQSLAQAVGSKYRVLRIALTETGLEEFKDTFRPSEPLLTSPEPGLRRALRLGSTPQTFVLSPEGTVAKVWAGYFEGPIRADVSGYFGFDF